MALKPKKKRMLIILVIILNRVVSDLNGDVTEGLNFDMATAGRKVLAMAEAVDEDDIGWSSDHEDVYLAADALGQCFESAGEPDYDTALADLNEALSKLV